MAAQFATESGDNPLWEFALTFYARPGVQQTLLNLQNDAGMDVLLLLTALWLGKQQCLLPDSLAEAGDYFRWREQVILPIRQARSHLNAEPLRSQQAVLRKQLLQSELQAEQEAIRLIFTWLQQQALTEQADCSAVNLTLLQNITMADNGSVTAQKKEARGPLLQQLLLLAK
ncbi:TIGR02444 family protein [Thalassolituus alkanivorans]|uniref:TIGR02444 family protein n=1 Tax=Thalassolituus alkanivorans TaxID=2881055 RepID=UPI001E40D99B|nr:TIGR02444 family protein [Thalassolituus alkanivorans]MCB2387667.1 TIGR02444 family protein [Thalassolituus alkanivorans]MCB2424931.1 TIGR02444 family protein [Thalassolituus alkanivorans]